MFYQVTLYQGITVDENLLTFYTYVLFWLDLLDLVFFIFYLITIYNFTIYIIYICVCITVYNNEIINQV